ncbi:MULTISPECIES: acyl-CoA dehydrogenase family protein [Rhodococcus]|uniref:Acyl-CoA dehydrogenase family protein n=1 Tax=Rhodococcus oxybenzonivorans TaxID=1990687 RepID=A0AAE4V2F8_9NOCA|nr:MULTISPECIES: acyl-CoA dehydrogenase family protein [Rhodococcus]MDV7245252.1 acyl-CoA dehydrogenase family protein [Rhodococcus oxybenzonivorans]MDV7267027.1 acyl-CoA dehydrogenase family protein [Rhodococcus oxybenzonivorans]MDV7272468.1 acyl-CoA dehydrogenase family protein [Rhodococcus oxybenzonivorans]MDV7336277.1 acyl-CoA dehydrogenase family protein [Rhodococcus oxybenzonivorans]MDV7342962.1 acyl-CoA dehydrogenase family protein [Rhodococcus oxybenzonivorans]
MTTPTIVDPDLVEMMKSVFTAHRDDAADSAEPAKFNPQLWRTLDELGLVRLTGSETHGGSGADWHAASALLSASAAAAVPVPLVEHDLLSGWLLETAGLPMDGGLRTAFLLADSAASSVAPWARDAEFMVVLRRTEASWVVADVARDITTLTPSQNLAGEPRDRVTVDVEAAQWTSVPDGVAEIFVLRGALARTLQVCGALERIVVLCIEHASSRTQFGRQLSKFQAVQRLVTGIATETALARSAADAAVASIERNGWDAPGASFAVAVAKSCAGHAASTVVRNAHQVHGAIGTTREHELHRYTRPVLSWRSEFGSVGQWDQLLTQTAVAAGRDEAWKLIVEGRPLSGVLDIAV